MLLAISDLDPSGDTIANDVHTYLRRDCGLSAESLTAYKAALTFDQVREFRLPAMMSAKETDPTREAFEERHCTSTVHELEALQPADLAELLSRDIRALDLLNRTPGESAANHLSAEERLAKWQAQDYADLDQQILRAEEFQCSSILFSGQLVMKDGDDDQILQELDFGAVNRTVIDPLKYWDTAAGDPLSDLTSLKRIVTSSGYMPSLFVLGADATQAFLNNDKVRQAYNAFNFRPGGAIDPTQRQEMADWGVSDIGQFWGMPIVSYEAMYEEDGLMKHVMLPDQVLVASTALPNRFCYGSIVQTEDAISTGDRWGAHAVGTYQLPRVPQYVTDPESDNLLFRLWSRPLAVPVNLKTWSVATVCTLKSQPIPIS